MSWPSVAAMSLTAPFQDVSHPSLLLSHLLRLHPGLAALGLMGLWALLGSCGSVASDSGHGWSQQVELSEDAAVDDALGLAVSGFVEALRRGELGDAQMDPSERRGHPFFYRSLEAGSLGADAVVLASHPVGGGREGGSGIGDGGMAGGCHLITVAFVSGPTEALKISRIVELEAVPRGDGSFRFGCPYERHTARLREHAIGSVTFRFSGTLDEARAADFVRLKERLEMRMGREPAALTYDCFPSLAALLRAFGLVHDASKCNFLEHDLGFLWGNGTRYSTGTSDPNYAFGYVRGLLSLHARDPKEVFAPYANGVAAYYGGYGLSGESVDDLARQFRQELARNPSIDFLAEFRKARGSSVERHFSHYVMCAFLCRELIARHGELEALQLVECGANGEHFFPELQRLLGVTEANFHASVVRWIGEG